MRISKCSLVAVLTILMLSTQAQQWQGTGPIYYNGGNVGIGTSNPQTTLHVEGYVAASYNNLSGFVQLWNDNAIIFKLGNRQGGLRFGSATDLSAGNWIERMRIADNGNVGIGTTNPFYTLDVVGSAKASYIEINSGIEDGGRLVLRSEGHPDWRIRNFNGLGFFPGEGQPTSLWLDNSGSVGVGVMDTKGHKFAVNGSAIFTKVVVKVYPWSDYVFHANYRLRPLSEVEEYIKQYHHLPEVPSAEEVEKNGLDVGDNQATLLKKIEELTLYAIQQNKKIEEQNKKQESWVQQLELMKEEINQLKRLLEGKTNK